MHFVNSNKILLLIFVLLYFAVAYVLFDYYGISCVFLEIFGLPCPGCGMTRAAIALVNLDFLQAIRHNVIIFFMPYVFMYVFFDFKHKIHTVLLATIALISVVNWVFKITMLFRGV